MKNVLILLSFLCLNLSLNFSQDSILVKNANISDSIKKTIHSIPLVEKKQKVILKKEKSDKLTEKSIKGIFEPFSIWNILKIIGLIVTIKILLLLVNLIIQKYNGFPYFYFIETTFNIFKFLIWFSASIIIASLVFQFEEYIISLIIILAMIFTGIASIGIIKNILGYILINFSRNISKGDLIEINGLSGEIIKISIRNVTITNNNQYIYIPNSLFITSPVKTIQQIQKENLVELDYSFPLDVDDTKINQLLYDSSVSSPYIFMKKQPKVILLNIDFINKIKHYKLQVYLIDTRYKYELINSVNNFISNSPNIL